MPTGGLFGEEVVTVTGEAATLVMIMKFCT